VSWRSCELEELEDQAVRSADIEVEARRSSCEEL
jgi:hypothetical protein